MRGDGDVGVALPLSRRRRLHLSAVFGMPKRPRWTGSARLRAAGAWHEPAGVRPVAALPGLLLSGCLRALFGERCALGPARASMLQRSRATGERQGPSGRTGTGRSPARRRRAGRLTGRSASSPTSLPAGRHKLRPSLRVTDVGVRPMGRRPVLTTARTAVEHELSTSCRDIASPGHYGRERESLSTAKLQTRWHPFSTACIYIYELGRAPLHGRFARSA